MIKTIGHLPLLVILLLVTAPDGIAEVSSPSQTTGEQPTANVSTGTLKGVRVSKVSAFLGIPYAAPPVGANRWRTPAVPADWSGVRPAEQFGPSCWQAVLPNGRAPWTHEYMVDGAVSEDCLYLNIWAPDTRRTKVPVLVWIHGGGFMEGSGSVPIYDGGKLASQGIIVVTINYRLGVLGFLAHPDLVREANPGVPPANYGLQDVIAALHWLHRNVAAFGGDAEQLTIAGQSAGAVVVHDLIASPLASGLFKRAIVESGLPNIVPVPTLGEAEQAGDAFARAKGATTIAQLRALPTNELAITGPPSPMPQFTPVADGVLLPDSSDRLAPSRIVNDTPILIGMTAAEDSAFSPYSAATSATAFNAFLDGAFGSFASQFATLYPNSTDTQREYARRALLKVRGLTALHAWSSSRLKHSRSPCYVYLWNYAEPGAQSGLYGAFHSSEIPYVFGTLAKSPERPFSDRDRKISLGMSRYWVNFVKTGDPNSAGLAHWPPARPSEQQLMELGQEMRPAPILSPAALPVADAFLASGANPTVLWFPSRREGPSAKPTPGK